MGGGQGPDNAAGHSGAKGGGAARPDLRRGTVYPASACAGNTSPPCLMCTATVLSLQEAYLLELKKKAMNKHNEVSAMCVKCMFTHALCLCVSVCVLSGKSKLLRGCMSPLLCALGTDVIASTVCLEERSDA